MLLPKQVSFSVKYSIYNYIFIVDTRIVCIYIDIIPYNTPISLSPKPLWKMSSCRLFIVFSGAMDGCHEGQTWMVMKNCPDVT